MDGWQLYYCAMSVTRIPACNILIVPDFSCLDKRGMINKVIKLKFSVFSIHVYLRTTCEMIKYFGSLNRGDATC